MSTAMPEPVSAPPPASGGPPVPGRRTDLAGDALVTAVAALELLPLQGYLDTESVLVCTPAVLVLLLRRRFPVTVLLVTLPSMATGYLWLAPMIAMFTVASRTVRRRIVVGAGSALFGASLWAGVTVDASSMTWGDHLVAVQVALMFSIGPAGVGILARTRSELRARLAELSASQAYGRRLEAERAVAQERTRMAREMHDTVSYHLGIIAAQSGALSSTAPDDTVREDAEIMRRHSASAMAELRDIVGVLRHTAGRRADVGDPARLANLHTLVKDARLDAVLNLDLPAGRTCVPLVERTAYRIVQEALTNVRKHAPGAHVVVTVGPSAQGDSLVVEVRNEPPSTQRQPGPALGAPTSGYGLIGLEERIALVEGALRAGPTPDGGFAVRAELPLVGSAYPSTELTVTR
ncbi:sensor histidine kinase [Streptomyces sp. NBC_01408]|uniref:sensor histidine kinase n=1 Tax=Streptomyces sp. NBC_01408 TaxID=2903855 RepID=UPI002251F61B|nr:histidine kinase [Streptomyces sp. NBC_01408]MCX4692053.1 histidine kinase [Streptomyces sp. NBC_01408]